MEMQTTTASTTVLPPPPPPPFSSPLVSPILLSVLPPPPPPPPSSAAVAGAELEAAGAELEIGGADAGGRRKSHRVAGAELEFAGADLEVAGSRRGSPEVAEGRRKSQSVAGSRWSWWFSWVFMSFVIKKPKVVQEVTPSWLFRNCVSPWIEKHFSKVLLYLPNNFFDLLVFWEVRWCLFFKWCWILNLFPLLTVKWWWCWWLNLNQIIHKNLKSTEIRQFNQVQ